MASAVQRSRYETVEWSNGSFCGFSGVVRSGSDGFVLLESVWQFANPSTGWGKLIKFRAPSLDVRELPGLPESFTLHQNYPNPFNPSTVIGFQLTVGGPVSLTVWNMLGQRVATLVDEKLPSGKYETVWDAAGAASGTYFYRLTTETFVETKKMVLLR